jgi:chemotaxis protein histidine kinase CheA
MEQTHEKTDINEILDTLEQLELSLVEFEHSIEYSVDKPDLVHLIFRHAHNLKSALYTLNKDYSSRLIHSIESNFDLLRKGKGSISTNLTNICLKVTDVIRVNITSDQENADDSENLIAKLEEIYQEQLKSEQKLQTVPLQLNENEYAAYKAAENLNIYAVEKLIDSNISKEEFEGLFIYEDIAEIGVLITTTPAYEGINKSNHQAILKIFFASQMEIKEVGMNIFDPLKQVIIEAYPEIKDPVDISENNDEKNIEDLEKALYNENFLIKYFDKISILVKQIETNIDKLREGGDINTAITIILADLHNLKGNSGFLGIQGVEDLVESLQEIFHNILESKIIFEKEILLTIISKTNSIKNLINTANRQLSKEALSEKEVSGENEGEDKEEKGQVFTSLNNSAKTDIRVETNKLDKLFDLVGELITVESMLLNTPEVLNIESHSFKKTSGMLYKITRELQEVTMSIRMVPLEGLFNRMKRVVRDLSHKTNKKVNLLIRGQETEMDKNIIEEIADPLVHIIRNSIDHGLEMEDERIERNKSREGTLKINARYEGNEIIICVEDDGKGLNREKIIKKAREKGLLKSDPDSLKDKQIWNYIFEPGFSTAEKLSEISGRGVGLDVVKKNIDKLRGKIEIDSIEDKGTRFSLRIPLTLAIIDTMLFRIGNTHYAVPLLSINQSFRPSKESITVTMDGQEVVNVRNELYPVIRLHEVLNKKSDVTELDKGILIMIEGQSRKVCFFVDEIIGQQQSVVKGLDTYLDDIRGVMGCIILGSGEIGLILDIDSIIDMSER